MFRRYYKYEEEHLPACTINVHVLLHIPDFIRNCGPVWMTWAFPMERYCGKMQAHMTSRLHPYAMITQHAKQTAQLSQIKICYTRVWDHLSNERPDGAISEKEVVYTSCKPIWNARVCVFPNISLRRSTLYTSTPSFEDAHARSRYAPQDRTILRRSAEGQKGAG
jgi:hypothetical protein